MTLRFQLAAFELLVDRHRGQDVFPIGELGQRIVGTLHISPQVPGEVNRASTDLELGAVGQDRDGHAMPPGIGHLTGNGSLPYQVVQPIFVVAESRPQGLGKTEGRARRTNRLVGLLRILDPGLIDPGLVGQVFLAVLRGHQLASRFHGHRGQIRRIGSHVGDVAVLVQALREPHRVSGRETVFAVGLLLQRTRRKRGIRLRCVGLVLDAPHAAVGLGKPRKQLGCLLFIQLQQRGVLQFSGG